MKRALLALILSGAACGATPTGPTGDVPLGREFRLAPGETASIQGTGLSVSFERVLADSRCPADVVCAWAGEAVVELQVSAGGPPTRLDLSTLAPQGALGAYLVHLERVEPYPTSDRTIAPGDYRLTLRVSRA